MSRSPRIRSFGWQWWILEALHTCWYQSDTFSATQPSPICGQSMIYYTLRYPHSGPDYNWSPLDCHTLVLFFPRETFSAVNIISAVDWFTRQDRQDQGPGTAGYGRASIRLEHLSCLPAAHKSTSTSVDWRLDKLYFNVILLQNFSICILDDGEANTIKIS